MNQAGFTTREVVLILIGVVAFAFAGWVWLQSQDAGVDPDVATIDSFESCVEAGYAVMESHPRQCAVPDGETFIEEIDEPVRRTYTSEGGVEITVAAPADGGLVESPLIVSGEVPGSWSFEADFPVELRDSDGEMIAQAPAMLQGDWMTEELVPFEATLEFPSQQEGSEGTLVLIKDNPSDNPDLDDRLEIPVVF